MKTTLKKTAPLFLGIAILLGWACSEIYDFEKISGMILYDPEVDAPLVRGSLTAEDLFAAWDSLMENSGDTVVLAFRKDSVFTYHAADFTLVPPQDTSDFYLRSAYTYPFMPEDSLVIDSIETYLIDLEDEMRIDSIYYNEGFLLIQVNSSFRHAGTLDIYSPDLYLDGQPFRKKIQISSTDGMFAKDTIFPMNNTRIYIDNSIPGQPFIRNFYHLVLQNNPGQGIDAGDRVQIRFSLVDFDKYEVAFGFAGNKINTRDTVFATGLEAIKGLTGTFSIIDPRIMFNYKNSFGFPIGVDLSVLGYFGDGHTVFIDPSEQTTEVSDNYLFPNVEGSLIYSRSNIPNIGDLLTFPVPDSLNVGGDARANPGVTNAMNFVLPDSRALVGLEVRVPLAFKADLQLRDTFMIAAMERPEQADFIEYAKLHYRIHNEFPVNLDPYLILYDSIADVNLDTLRLAESLTDPFIKAAPVDADGVTIASAVEDYTGSVVLSEELMDHFFHGTNKLIMVGSFSSYQTDNVVILTTYRFDFRCNLEVKIRYETDIFNNTSNE